MDARQGKGETMKRTPELRTLSEVHHHSLVHARRLRRATEGDEITSAESTARDSWISGKRTQPSTFAKKRRSSCR